MLKSSVFYTKYNFSVRFKVPQRVPYEWNKTPLPLSEISYLIANETAVLVNVNTRKETQHLHSLLVAENHSF